jgi:CBS domain-containing protein
MWLTSVWGCAQTRQNVSGLAVLDDKATLMGTISIRDLKVRL